MKTEQQYSRLDIAFSQFLVQRKSLDKHQQKKIGSIVARLSCQQSQGHSCIQLDRAEQDLMIVSGLVSENDLTPLILEQNRLYLQRYWFYENRLAEQLKKLHKHTFQNENLEFLLKRYFIDLVDETDWQRVAAQKVVSQAFSIITGGPGTGKTTTVVKILALLQESFIKQEGLLIALAAPTGKAAMRLQQSIGSSKTTLPCSEQIKKLIPETVTTIHQLLGAKPPSPYFKHDATNLLVYDLVVIDEASMVDLALMSKLVDALKPGSRLILLGDKDQLASVESGSVLADLTAALPEQTQELKKSYRFEGEIKALADAVNSQSADVAWQILKTGIYQVSLLEENLIDYIAEKYSYYCQLIKNDAGFKDIYAAFCQFQVLCSNRYGQNGVNDINDKVEQKLVRENKIQQSGTWYPGRPIMVTQNNTGMQLYNGDIGICLDDSLLTNQVFFLRSDGSVKKVMASRIPAHETVFAMTIHKSQGSEFEECVCVLPEKTNPVLSKELVYTAVTRAKKGLILFSSYSVFCQALQKKVVRTGGLLEKLGEE